MRTKARQNDPLAAITPRLPSSDSSGTVEAATTASARDSLIADMIDDGVTELDGSLPTVGNVSKSWQRVLRDVAACEAATAALPKRPAPASPGAFVTRPPLSVVQPPPYVPVPIPGSAPVVPRAFTGRMPVLPPPGSPGAETAAAERMERFMQSLRSTKRKPFPS